MPERDWNGMYASGDLPWDAGRPEEELVAVVEAGVVRAGKALEIGCGTGTNALWLASRGFEVVAVDVAPLAIEQARAKLRDAGLARCRFEVLDILTGAPADGPFDFVFDRGCFHVFDDAGTRARFAARVADALATGGHWLSVIGSTEGAPRDTGPPRRTARDVVTAIEPVLEIIELRATVFDPERAQPPRAWRCLSRKRVEPAQPSTG